MNVFNKKSDAGYRTARAGVSFRTLAFGERTHLTEFRLAKGSIIPQHDHPHEQTGYLVSGRMRFIIAGEVFDTGPGDGWNIPGGLSHGVEVLEDSVAIEVFSPVREDYLP
ncbi:MAG: cupin domain-containing protein [Acidobacteriota bacterium]